MIKALGGLGDNQNAKTDEKDSALYGDEYSSMQNNQPTISKTEQKTQPKQPKIKNEQPNLMAEAILRHEQISNRIKRK